MIQNENQYTNTKYWLARFEDEANALEAEPLPEGVDPAVKQAYQSLIAAARSQAADLREEIAEYERRTGKVTP